jgi:hypothetical protein
LCAPRQRRAYAAARRREPDDADDDEGNPMPTIMIFHEVDDAAHWAASPKRAEAFATIGATVRAFVDPEGSNRVGIIAEIPDMDAFQAMLTSDMAAEAMKHDGVRPETIVILAES